MRNPRDLGRSIGVWVVFAVVLVTMAAPANAIPAFARKYSMSCTTCHAPVPRLKAFGDDFAGNGFVMEDQDAPRYTAKTGDDNLELIRSFPIAARLDGMLKAHSDSEQGLDFSAPYNLKLLSGGSISKNIAYYFYFFMSERGEVAGVEDAYIMFNNMLGQDLDLYVGQFQVSDPLFKRELRLTYEDYMIYKAHDSLSRISLTYDRGLMLTWGIEGGPDIILEVLNGNGIGEADEKRTFDDDRFKTYAGRISYDLNENIRVGGFGYLGKETGTDGFANYVTYYGPDLTVALDKFEVNVQYLERLDDNPNFLEVEPSDKVKTRGSIVEGIFWPNGDQSTWYAAGLYNFIDRDEGEAFARQVTYQTLTGHVGWVVKSNLRLYLENTYDLEDQKNRLIIGFVSAF